jgi:hypothetical protein
MCFGILVLSQSFYFPDALGETKTTVTPVCTKLVLGRFTIKEDGIRAIQRARAGIDSSPIPLLEDIVRASGCGIAVPVNEKKRGIVTLGISIKKKEEPFPHNNDTPHSYSAIEVHLLWSRGIENAEGTGVFTASIPPFTQKDFLEIAMTRALEDLIKNKEKQQKLSLRRHRLLRNGG